MYHDLNHRLDCSTQSFRRRLRVCAWPINRMLTRIFLVFRVVGLWTFFAFKIVLYSVKVYTQRKVIEYIMGYLIIKKNGLVNVWREDI